VTKQNSTVFKAQEKNDMHFSTSVLKKEKSESKFKVGRLHPKSMRSEVKD
jgi:hypothetical protein